MTAEFILLGIGGAFDADEGVANTGGLLCVEDGTSCTRILIDCGHTCGGQLRAVGLGYEDIDAVLLTHTHGDHIDGLETMGYKSLFLHKRRVAVYAPAGILDQVWHALAPKMDTLQVAADQAIEATMPLYFDPKPVAPDSGPIEVGGGVTAEFVPVRHVRGMPCYGIILQLDTGETIRWSGDCIFQPEGPILGDVQPGDLVFHDCAFYPAYDATVHTHLEQLATLPEAIRREIVLVHHGRVMDTPEPREGMHLGQPLERFEINR
jgi:ribonuclease BN (tRNA processing enzyme)